MKKLTLRIERDDFPESPREWDNLGAMACWHRNYILGDVQPKQEPNEWLKENAPEGSIILPLCLYDHSGITMSVGHGGGWDSGPVGYIVATPDAIRKAYVCKRISKATRAKAEALLRNEVRTYDNYLTGNVYCYIIEDENHNHIDSCSGFYGYETAEEEGRLQLAYAEKAQERNEQEQHEWNCRD